MLQTYPISWIGMNNKQEQSGGRATAVISSVLDDGRIVELVYSPKEKKTRLAVGKDRDASVVEHVRTENAETLIPVPATNNLIRHEVVLLPERPESYESTDTLIKELNAFIERYVDFTPGFRAVAVSYILLSWVYDAFSELPYLRLRGNFGSGKTRALTVLGSIAYKGFFASGASTVSPIFHTLDAFRGTLILDEADFRFSDEQADIVKILNNGNARRFPVLRQSMTINREFNPRAFTVYGPKIVAMRHSFDDPALESRFITEDMGLSRLRRDIPLNLPETFDEEARHLRNMLLMYRYETLPKIALADTHHGGDRLARTDQLLRPLLAVIPDEETRRVVEEFSDAIAEDVRTDQALLPEGMLLEVLAELFRDRTRNAIPVSEITAKLAERHGRNFDRALTPRYVGELLRKRLHLKTYRVRGTFLVSIREREKIMVLAERARLQAPAELPTDNVTNVTHVLPVA